MPSGAEIALNTAFALLVFTDIFGNSMVCFIILHKRFRFHRSALDKLLVNLAAADMILALFVAPRYVFHEAFAHPSGQLGDYLCRFITGGSLIWLGGAASIFCLVAIAFERRQVVLYPYHGWSRAAGKLKAVIITSWFFAFVLNVPLFFVMKYNKDIDFCIEKWPNNTLPIVYGVLWFVAAGAIPVVLMVVLYTTVVYKLWIKRAGNRATRPRGILLVRKRATKLAITVTVIYAVCWLPILVLYILAFNDPQYEYGSTLYRATVLLSCLNSSVNPFVYGLQSRRFRQHFKQVILCRFQSV